MSAISAPAQLHCDLCDLPCGPDALPKAFETQEKRFCCAGCLNVYTVLAESGMIAGGADFRQSELYLESLRLGLISNRGAAGEARLSIPETAEVRESLYRIDGLWCGACGWIIEHALMREHGVQSAEVSFTSDLLKVRWYPQFLEPERIPRRVVSLGYRLSEYSGDRDIDRAAWREILLKLGLAFGLWMNVMLFSLVVYASYFESIAAAAHRVVPFILMALTTPVVFWSGAPILRIAYHGMREGAIRMEALIATGILAAYGYSVVQAVQGGQHYYFDTACAIVTLVLAGKAMERAAREKTASSVALLYRLMPKKARVLQGGRERFVAVDALQPGVEVLVKPGERVPVDGLVLRGSSSVDESVLTGESEPRLKAEGSEVAAGSINGAGVLELRSTRTGSDSTLAHIIRAVEAAIHKRTSLERSVDRASRLFVPVVLAIAAATLLVGIASGLPTFEAGMRSIAVLVIACPCALGIATPLATTAAIGAASSRGILIRDASVLETFRKVDVVVLDKTGTATEGVFAVREAEISRSLLEAVGALESRSEHPLARAIVSYSDIAATGDISDVLVHQGAGVSGYVDGQKIVVGSRHLIGEIPPALARQAASWEGEGLTVVYVRSEEGVGALALGDRPRSDAAALVSCLNAENIKTVLLSGDSSKTTAQVAAKLAVTEYRAEVSPAGKAEFITSLRSAGKVVAMVGDGINDAPALAAADIGLAMGTGTDLAMQAAPVVLMSASLLRIQESLDIARTTSRVVRQNLFWAFFYNSVGITLAVAGVLNPILAAGAMVISSLSVVGSSLRLGRRVRRPVGYR